MPDPVERQVSGTVTPSGPTLDEFALPAVELVDSVRSGVTGKKNSVVVHRDLCEMTGAGRWCDHVCHKLVVSRASLRLQDTHAFVRIEPCILATVPEVDEVGSGVIEKAVRITLDLEVLNRPEGLALENPHMAIEAGYIQVVEVTAQEQRVLSVLYSADTFDHLPVSQVHNLHRIVCDFGHKQALLLEIHAHVIEAPGDPRQRNGLDQLERLFFLSGCLVGETGKHGNAAHYKRLRHGSPPLYCSLDGSIFCGPGHGALLHPVANVR